MKMIFTLSIKLLFFLLPLWLSIQPGCALWIDPSLLSQRPSISYRTFLAHNSSTTTQWTKGPPLFFTRSATASRPTSSLLADDDLERIKGSKPRSEYDIQLEFAAVVLSDLETQAKGFSDKLQLLQELMDDLPKPHDNNRIASNSIPPTQHSGSQIVFPPTISNAGSTLKKRLDTSSPALTSTIHITRTVVRTITTDYQNHTVPIICLATPATFTTPLLISTSTSSSSSSNSISSIIDASPTENATNDEVTTVFVPDIINPTPTLPATPVTPPVPNDTQKVLTPIAFAHPTPHLVTVSARLRSTEPSLSTSSFPSLTSSSASESPSPSYTPGIFVTPGGTWFWDAATRRWIWIPNE